MDYGHKIADDELKKLEKRLKKEYAKAAKEAQKKTDDYFERFKIKDKERAKQLKEGKITKQEYNQWRTNQMFVGNRWQDLTKQIVSDYQNANNIAADMIRNHSYDMYALNFNYGTFEVEKGTLINTSFTLYDRDTVKRLILDNPQLLPEPSELLTGLKANQYTRSKLQSVAVQSILQGESIPNMAMRLAQETGETDLNVAIRNARTMTTSAENAGRNDSYKRAQDMGIKMKRIWVATLDSRTRDSHREVDGEAQEIGDTFSNGLEYPGDMSGDPAEVYNCRCTLIADVKGSKVSEYLEEQRKDFSLEGQDYNEWKNRHTSTNNESGVVNGHDITNTWKRRSNSFDFEIEDVINAQGFDGLPTVVSPQEFDKAVKAANNGNGFVAQRTYSAPSKEVLDEYRNQLYNGKWYVDCSTGGAQYGQGMYCAADYTGTLSKGIKEEMGHYKRLGEERLVEQHIDIGELSLHKRALSSKMTTRWLNDEISGSELQAFQQKLAGMSDIEYAKKYMGIKIPTPVSYTETLTLHPSAKVITYDDLNREYRGLKSYEQAKYEDLGSFAAAMGYDAINAVGHGKSGSYTVILNRTKCIIKGAK